MAQQMISPQILSSRNGGGFPESLPQTLASHMHIHTLFEFQAMALSEILSDNKKRRDVCISAPTGSGKTLIYGLAIIHALRKRIVRRCRCVVVVPSKDLASQVVEVLRILAHDTDLVFAVLGKNKSFQEETKSLVSSFHDEHGIEKYDSKVDGIVCTPGRLVDHLDRSPGFTLEHVELLVVDEVDKLLSQSYQDWLERIYERIHNVVAVAAPLPQSTKQVLINVECHRTRKFGNDSLSLMDFSQLQQQHANLRRILCSATLTQDPQKLNALALIHPLIFVHSQRLPTSLSEEAYLVNKEKHKLSFLVFLLTTRFQTHRAMIFASSVERATKLHALLSTYLPPGRDVELISGEVRPKKRAKVINNLKRGDATVLICSDVAARGLDVEDLPLVISYDVPSTVVSYVHRAGRTARAGHAGLFVVLLGSDQAWHFKGMKKEMMMGAANPHELFMVRVGKVDGYKEFKKTWVGGDGGGDDDVMDDENR